MAFDQAYYEFEVNPFGTIYEGLFVWQSAYDKYGFSKVPAIDRSRGDVTSQDFNGVGYKSHPRGLRHAFLKWDFPGAKVAVSIDGTLNDNSDRDRGWTVELPVVAPTGTSPSEAIFREPFSCTIPSLEPPTLTPYGSLSVTKH